MKPQASTTEPANAVMTSFKEGYAMLRNRPDCVLLAARIPVSVFRSRPAQWADNHSNRNDAWLLSSVPSCLFLGSGICSTHNSKLETQNGFSQRSCGKAKVWGRCRLATE